MIAAPIGTDHADMWHNFGVQSEFEQKLQEWVEIPSVSADPDRHKDIVRMAQTAADNIRAFGGDAEIAPTPGNPVVVGRFFRSAQLPTVTVYNHLDVQPANEPQWVREPFVFHKDGNRYFGRGATDDKGPALTALFGARQAVREGVPVNIQFIWELEEEIGSPNFEHFMKSSAGQLRTDSIAVSDTIWISRGKPAIAYGLRGLAPFRIILQTGSKDVHSGLTGGAARNPLGELCQIAAECYDATTGRVKIPGFYDNVLKLSEEELEGFVASGFNTRRFKTAHELKSLRVQDEKEVVKRIWASPTFEVHGVAGGYTGPGVKTAIPPAAELKVSMRLVPNQKPDQVFRLVRSFIKKRHPDAQILPESFLKPFLGPRHGPHFEAARSAMKAAFGKEPALVREGGSIGAVVTMQKYLRAPILLLGLSLPEHGYHAPNENFDWEQAEGGVRMFVNYFRNLASMGWR
jgi:acetylornithine deacetylase/succinyl-diaminopimelate desuccinylase-like protein